ncbi:MAG TPA: SUMF1/EgtB/PvdO family nonheme iron enzyme, partial [Pirellulales bacterium]|nr:SUMF1/EgtB/PvdO family nonheme iron enzyme [Pirellulales bacterium]
MNVEPEAPQAGGSLKIRLTGHDPEDDAISFEYRTGPNEPWQIAADGRVLLPELAEGPLAVEVRARDSGGRISEIVKRTLEVKRATPPPAVVPFSEKDARQHQEAWAKYIKRAVVETNSIGMKLVLIPPGRFMMGQGSDEAIIHEVTLTKAFYLADREVTVEQFQQFIEDSQYPATEKPQNWGGAH